MSADKLIQSLDRLSAGIGSLFDFLNNSISNKKIDLLRRQVPYAVVMPFPNHVQTYVLSANTPQDISIPTNARMVRFKGNADYYINRNGAAAVPAATDETGATAALYKPEDQYFWVEEIHSLSIVAPGAAIVSMQVFSQL